MSRTLRVCINQKEVGLLIDSDGLWCLQYSGDWLADPQCFALSPDLPLSASAVFDGASRRPVQWYFDNLLSEESQRVLLARDAKIDVADAFSLLAWYGAESAGSLTLLLPETLEAPNQPPRPLSDNALERRILQLPKVSLNQGAVKRMSLAGTQHKLAVIMREGALFEPIGSMPSTHILKPDHPDEDYPHSVINEWFVMRLAKRLGLDVPEVHRRYVPTPVYLISRFDRMRKANGIDGSIDWERQHAIDACQLLGLDRSFKYNQGSIENLARLGNACRSPAVARSRLYNWLVFNVLVGNSDAHLKNLSFMVSSDGIQLAPFYDLLSVATYETRAFEKNIWPTQSQIAWPILDVKQYKKLSRDLLLKAGEQMQISKTTALQRLENLRSRIVHQAKELFNEVSLENEHIVRERPELAATMAGELRCLNTIIYTVIQEMQAQIA